jgi:hypothetical protein
LLSTHRLPRPAKFAFFCAVTVSTGYAVINNLQAIHAMGLSPLGMG